MLNNQFFLKAIEKVRNLIFFLERLIKLING